MTGCMNISCADDYVYVFLLEIEQRATEWLYSWPTRRMKKAKNRNAKEQEEQMALCLFL